MKSKKLYTMLTIFGIAFTLFACGEDAPPPPPEPDPLTHPTRAHDEVLYDAPELNDSPGHWSKEQRAITLDLQDEIILKGSVTGQDGIQNAIELIQDHFSVLSITRPLLDLNTGASCIEEDKALEYQPKQGVEKILAMVKAQGLSFDKVVVNIELLYPQRNHLYQLCLNTIDDTSFFLTEHRTNILNAFKDLAQISDIDAITVGASLNDYYYFDKTSKVNYQWDYSNLVYLYHEIYTTIKEQNNQIQVGPGFRWSTFMNESHAEIANKLDLDLSDSIQSQIAFESAVQVFVHPFLADYDREGNAKSTADYIGIDLRIDPVTQPFNGIPSPDDLEPVQDYFKFMSLFGNMMEAESLPLSFVQVDWHSSNSANAGNKAIYLKHLKEFLSHVDPLWVAWRRFGDLPSVGDNTCNRFVNDVKKYDKDYCFSGLVDDLGKVRSVFDELTTDP